MKSLTAPLAGHTALPMHSIVADLVIGGPGTDGGALHIEGAWEVPGAYRGYFKISGTLCAKRVAVLVP